MAKLPARPSLFDQLFRDFPNGYSIAPLHGVPLPSPGKIKIDVKESGDCLIVQAEAPRAAKDVIDVSVEKASVKYEDGILVLKPPKTASDKQTKISVS